MQIISLFSGIGGFELAGRWMGWDPVVSCEINPFGRKVLEYHFPEAYHHDNVKTLTYETIKEHSRWDENGPTILVGGFPCQPFSETGLRKGTEDDRHLWPQMLRIIREVQPDWVVGENVPGILSWSRGMVVKEIKTNLEDEGFTLLPPLIIPACSVGADHRRDRVWFVANANNKRLKRGKYKIGTESQSLQKPTEAFPSLSFDKSTDYILPEPKVIGRNDGIPTELDGITFSKWREESIKAYGNAIVPQVAFQIFKAIAAMPV